MTEEIHEYYVVECYSKGQFIGYDAGNGRVSETLESATHYYAADAAKYTSEFCKQLTELKGRTFKTRKLTIAYRAGEYV